MQSRFRVAFTLFLGLTLLTGVCGANAGLPHCSCEGQPVLELTTPPTAGKVVKELQKRLTELGYYQGPSDGTYTCRTARAVARFQQDLGIPVTGKMDPVTWAYLAWVEEEPVAGQPLPPPAGEISILVDTDALILIVYVNGEPHKIYPVAVGKWLTPTPLGEWRVTDMSSVWRGPFGARWIGLSCPWGSYGIHGTDTPSSIGQEVSSGCVRMYNHDVIELFEWVSPDTPVTIIGSRLSKVSIPPRLQRGDVGQSVVPLQMRLRELGQPIGCADGVFGEATEKAVREIQIFFRLPPDGVADSTLLYLLDLRQGEGA